MIPWLEPTDNPHFPDTAAVLAEPAGLLAAGGRLDVEWLLVAYRQGIFPWFSENEPILWWCPAPRTVLYPKRFYQSKSLQKLARQQRYQITLDQDFEAVIEACAGDRKGQSGTWINSQIIDAYIEMHGAGFAHSIECRHGDELVGGLYGIALGRVFFGESMFSHVANASKLCLKYLVDSGRYEMIDCQLPTEHLHSLGAIEIGREEFESALNRWI
ncbi:MAG: leucyl/phenylalanyl-tRNA--protein transferase [Gammaproteobacteria bacterium]|nr:leucyl/phenylalanyl-tRNA--protein transferase [Gammaproteobacteria bacterium]